MDNWALKLIQECYEKRSTYLDLGMCQLRDDHFIGGSPMDMAIKKCTHLTTLVLSNEWVALTNNGYDSSKNQVGWNKLTMLPPALEYLPNLTKLICAGDNYTRWGIRDLTLLESLPGLNYLDLSHNTIEDIDPLVSTPELETLYLNRNLITDINPMLGLHKLKKLNLAENRITDISPLQQLILQSQSPLKVVLKEPAQLGKNQINVKDNLLTTPPIEIITQGDEAIVNYFRELEKQGIDYLFEAKMLIVGQPRAGKTSLRYKLYNAHSPLPEEDKTTRGIDIERISFPIRDKEGIERDFYYNVWDFGGQQIYQTTHQFFLTHRSLYVLVMDTGNDSIGNDDSTINYWLQAVELLGTNSPLLLVLNEKNDRKIHLDLPQKKARFNFLKKEYAIDLHALIPGHPAFKQYRKSDFDILKADIETELSRLPLVGFPMPKNWVKIREALQKLSVTDPYINQATYQRICSRFDVKDSDRQSELSRIFHDLGIFLHFQDYGMLDDFIVLQNTWATDAVFAVFDNELVKQNNGRFTEHNLAGIWQSKGYGKEVHQKLLGLMLQFELCYQVDNTQPFTYIVPEMLPDKALDIYSWSPRSDLPLQYRYDFMPKGLLTRLIVRLNRNIYIENNQQWVWKTGVKINGSLMDCPNTFAEIVEAWNNKQLNIRIQGRFSSALMSKITHEIDELNKDYFKQVHSKTQGSSKSKWYKMVPCNCISCNDNNDKHFYDYNKLLEKKEYGKTTTECEIRPYATVNINELLEGVFSDKDGKEPATDNGPGAYQPGPGKKIFISYAHKDEKWKDQLVENLSTLRNQELIGDWTDRQIEAGLWDPQIEAAMQEADIFLLMITRNFLSSTYITSKEITTAYARFKAGKAIIFPVICDACAWELQPITREEKALHPVERKELYLWLGKFQPFPKDGKPIKKWANRQDGFLDVINQLKKYL